MPHSFARIPFRCAAATIGVLLTFNVCPFVTPACNVHAVERSADPAEATRELNFQNEAKSLLLAERPHAGSRQAGQPNAENDAAPNDSRLQVVSEGTSSRALRKKGTAAIPINRLTPEGQQKVQKILKSAAIFRELPTLAFEVEPSVYQYFLMHPDVAVSIWRAMGVSEFKMFQTGPVAYEADAGDGTVGLIDVLYRSNTDSVVICNGEFKSPLLVRPIKANALMHLQTEYRQSENGRKFVQHRLKMFVDFPSTTIETAAKIVTPVTNHIVDRNFHEVSLFLHMMSLAMSKRPDWVEGIAGRLDGVLEPSKAELVSLTTQVNTGAQQMAQPPIANGNSSAPGTSQPRRVAASPRPPATR